MHQLFPRRQPHHILLFRCRAKMHVQDLRTDSQVRLLPSKRGQARRFRLLRFCRSFRLHRRQVRHRQSGLFRRFHRLQEYMICPSAGLCKHPYFFRMMKKRKQAQWQV